MGTLVSTWAFPYEAKAWRSWSRETAKIAAIMTPEAFKPPMYRTLEADALFILGFDV